MSNIPEFDIYRDQSSPKASSFVKGVQYVSEVSVNGMLRVIERINLEDMGIAVRSVPVGGTKGAEDLVVIFKKARQGFRLLSRMQKYESERIDPYKFFDTVGVSEEDKAAELVNDIFPSRKLADPNKELAISVALLFMNTISILAQRDTVNFYQLGIIPTKDDPHLVSNTSDWKMNLSQEAIWDTIGQMGYALRMAVFKTGHVESIPVLYKAAHFLGANVALTTGN